MAVKPLDWQGCKTAFIDDGFLRQIVVAGTTLADWQRYTRFLRRTEAVLRLVVDGKEQALPPRLDEGLFLPAHNSVLIIGLADIELICTLSSRDTLRIDLHPGDIRNDNDLRLVFRIMSTLGRRLRKPVVLVHEKDKNRLFSLCPWRRAQHAAG